MQKSKTEIIRKQLAFLAELDRLKSIIRQSPLINRSRRENSAEHSWHLALFALILSEHGEDVDPLHVAKLLLCTMSLKLMRETRPSIILA